MNLQFDHQVWPSVALRSLISSFVKVLKRTSAEPCNRLRGGWKNE